MVGNGQICTGGGYSPGSEQCFFAEPFGYDAHSVNGSRFIPYSPEPPPNLSTTSASGSTQRVGALNDEITQLLSASISQVERSSLR